MLEEPYSSQLVLSKREVDSRLGPSLGPTQLILLARAAEARAVLALAAASLVVAVGRLAVAGLASSAMVDPGKRPVAWGAAVGHMLATAHTAERRRMDHTGLRSLERRTYLLFNYYSFVEFVSL